MAANILKKYQKLLFIIPRAAKILTPVEGHTQYLFLHAVTRGWGDIGYNYLIDQKGNIYEGRYEETLLLSPCRNCQCWLYRYCRSWQL